MKELFPYQKEGAAWLVSQERCVLADEMGMGKTAQAIEAAKLAGSATILVICRNRLKYNWAREIREWYRIAPVTVVAGTTAEKIEAVTDYTVGFLVVSYEAMRSKEVLDLLLRRKWDAVIIDEAHWLCNRKSQSFAAAKKLSKRSKYWWMLTGTYFRNRVPELWSLLHLCHHRRYSSFWKFVQQHAEARPGKFGWTMNNFATDPDELAAEIADIVLQRDRAMVGVQGPRKWPVKQVWLEFEPGSKQQKLYAQMEQHMAAEYADQLVTAPLAIAQIARLKQLCISPGLLFPNYREGSTKVEAIVESARQHVEYGRKFIIFSQFTEALDLFVEPFAKLGIKTVEISGRQNDAQQLAAERSLQEDPDTVGLLANMAAGGEGLNLTSASVTIFLDKPWNSAVLEQCKFRTDRYGQKNDLYVEEYLMSGTVEEWIEDEHIVPKAGFFKQVSDLLKARNRGPC